MNATPVSTPLVMPTAYTSSTPAPVLPWSHVEERLDAASVFWLATTRRNGAPHVAPIWAIWHAGSIYFYGYKTSTWARNLASNPAASFNLENGVDVAILDGVVKEVPTIPDEDKVFVGQRWVEKYGSPITDPHPYKVYQFRVRRVRAWTQFPDDATAWNFD